MLLVSKVCFSFAPSTIKNTVMNFEKLKNELFDLYEPNELVALCDEMYTSFLAHDRGNKSENEAGFYLTNTMREFIREFHPDSDSDAGGETGLTLESVSRKDQGAKKPTSKGSNQQTIKDRMSAVTISDSTRDFLKIIGGLDDLMMDEFWYAEMKRLGYDENSEETSKMWEKHVNEDKSMTAITDGYTSLRKLVVQHVASFVVDRLEDDPYEIKEI